jgi:large subunit ribosomal protein L4
VYVALSANLRQPIAHTKNRGERSGSGIKPWRQKGTGRARIGSVRAPHWRKGGVVFGPRNDRNYAQEIPRKMRQKATLVALSEKLRSEKLVILENFAFADMKTKAFAALQTALGTAGRSMLIGFSAAELPVARMTRNIPKMEHALAADINVKQLLDREYLLLSKESLEALLKRFAAWDKKA